VHAPTGDMIWWQVLPFAGRCGRMWAWQVWHGERLVGRGRTEHKWTGTVACWRCIAVLLWRRRHSRTP
jgi:hypothetical protein